MVKFVPSEKDNDINNETCLWIIMVAEKFKCEFVKETKDCDGMNILHAHYLLYCLMNNAFYAPFVLMIFIVILFAIVGTIADDFICPLMAAVASILRLSESVAGVTILALANGTPDLMSALTSLEQEASDIMFCSLIGSGLIDTTLIVGVIVFLERFKFQPIALIRDCGFYLFSVSVFFFFYWQQKWTIMCSVFFIIVYVIYAVVVLGKYFYDLLTIKEGSTDDDTASLIIERSSFSSNISEDKMKIFQEFRALWIDLVYMLRSDRTELTDKNIISKIFYKSMIPISVVLKLFIPQFNFLFDKNGWCKALYMVNVFFFPTLTVFCFDYAIVPRYIIQTIIMGIVFAIVVYVTSSRIRKPRYHNLVICQVFFTSFMLINISVNNIINLLRAIASKFSFSKTTLPLTILAIGNCVGDFVTNINLARTGLPRMAIAACYAGPLFNLVFDAGFIMVYVFLISEKTSMKVEFGEMGPLGILFLFIVLIITLTVLPLIYYEARKSFAIFLFILYTEFIFLLILCELGLTYPIGKKEFLPIYDDDDVNYLDTQACDQVYGKCG